MHDMKQTFLDVLQRFDTGMLCTRQPDGTMRARPMAVARVDENGDVWFVTNIGSGKVEEVLKDPHVLVTFQSRARFLSLTGRAELVGDTERIQQLWRDEWTAWFTEGREDPRLSLLHVRAVEADYWDASAAKGVRHAFEAAKAALKGEPALDGSEHGHLML